MGRVGDAEATGGADDLGLFSERDFYLAEFRGRMLAIAVPAIEPSELGPLESVLVELESNRVRVLLVSQDRLLLEKLVSDGVASTTDPGWLSVLWRSLQRGGRAAALVPGAEPLEAACRRIVQRVRPAKLVWIDPAGPLRGPDGARVSLIDLAGLEALLGADAGSPESGLSGALSPERRRLLLEIHALVSGDLPAVNLCSVAGLADDLFTFEGSGTFFARDRYLTTRYLSLTEFDAAHRLIRRGVEEGYLVDRSPRELGDVLANAFGVFVEDRHLAGVGALLRHELPTGAAAGEISSLYTLTRFLGEGVGAHLVGFAVERAARDGLDYVFACTTSDRVRTFFERHGFAVVGPEAVPPGKWRGYPPERRSLVTCLRRDLD